LVENTHQSEDAPQQPQRKHQDTIHLANLRLALERMHRYGLKMNPLKCAFGVSARKFLGFIVLEKGIEIDPKKN
jgi:site-specific recombinase XerC